MRIINHDLCMNALTDVIVFVFSYDGCEHHVYHHTKYDYDMTIRSACLHMFSLYLDNWIEVRGEPVLLGSRSIDDMIKQSPS